MARDARLTSKSRQTQKWQVARVAAIKRDQARQHAWWEGLDSSERRARQTRYPARFAQLSVEAQREFKSVAAQRGIVDGVSSAVRHQRWIYAMDPDELAIVAMERAARFAALPRPVQVAYVQAWEGHRPQLDVPRRTARRPVRTASWLATCFQHCYVAAWIAASTEGCLVPNSMPIQLRFH